mmetsp:Transcript_68235/g.127358  ORF Transcript_68235/g.127358 Transcript_68235/m.127358 type:complete len:353 (+) Transcript_68235:69-1127(+)
MSLKSLLSGIWSVSTHGRVCSTRGRVFHGSRNCDGALRVWIQGKNHCVSRLVAFAHLRVPPTSLHVNVLHRDRNVANNHVSNLMYATSQECPQITKQSRKGCEYPSARKPVLSRSAGELIWAVHPSAYAAADACGVSYVTVRECCLQGRATRSGVEFRDAQSENLCGEEWRPALHPLTRSLLLHTMISSRGRVFNSKGICTWGSTTASGYQTVSIGGSVQYVHRLVLCSFSDSLPSYSWVVNHIDGNKQNNCLENLEFSTPAQNVEHAVRNGLCKSTRSHRPVLGRHLSSKEWTRFESQTAAAMHVGCCRASIVKACRGLTKSVKGWEFQSLDEATLPGEQWAPVVLEPPAV